LQNYQAGDHILMVGDPTLCAICASVALEYEEELIFLRWDNSSLDYAPLTLNFSFLEVAN
jgi:hypothetical protein